MARLLTARTSGPKMSKKHTSRMILYTEFNLVVSMASFIAVGHTGGARPGSGRGSSVSPTPPRSTFTGSAPFEWFEMGGSAKGRPTTAGVGSGETVDIVVAGI